MRLLLITPKVDPTDNLFGHVNGWAAALAQRVERLYVVALWPGQPDLPANVRFATLGKAAENAAAGTLSERVGWLLRLQRIVARLAARHEIDAVLAHMGPVFAAAAAPIARLSGIPTYLWYAHGHVSPILRLAHALVRGVGTSTPEGFRIASPKVTITGQGIDLARFRPAAAPPAAERLLSVGRFSPIKSYETVLEAVAHPLLAPHADLAVELVGGVHSASEAAYLDSLRDRARLLGLADRVQFVDGLPYAQIVPTYQRATLFATASATGSMDKVVLEAAACGLPPLVCNPAFRELFGAAWADLSFGGRDDAAGLSTRLASWLGRSLAERREAALILRERIGHEHSVEHWADAVVGMIERGRVA
ncbi:MAG: glycosyltransferase family 4 protein [Chloroflexi bacterium]|nr:glycosyltransferase family 4 protein [Chloroflexota bacterium]